MGIEILFENAQIIALAKPSGQLVIPGRGTDIGIPLVQELQEHLKKKPYVIHRIDRGASGIVLFAKDPRTHQALCAQFERREIHKTYLVLVQGAVQASGQIDQPIKTFGSGRMGVHPSGKPSQTDFRIVKAYSNATLLEVSPTSGRRHQIRVHLYSIGHPVLGDPLYGVDRPVGGVPRLMLHAWKLELTLRVGETLALEAPLPADFNAILGALQ